ncbi:hypothetical protein D9613_012839 [Agrocybe pediades]|uniref:Uncharacterized protein n=1 Tax=Agrocybe pediades TaxID=84607 RepID=A0A8H4VPY3_9AGAR|nr:hypothetical protein D9613_012839 [Agrocybe pediades]
MTTPASNTVATITRSPSKCVVMNASAAVVNSALDKARVERMENKADACAHHAAICSASSAKCAKLANDIREMATSPGSTNPHFSREQRLGHNHTRPAVIQPAWDTVHDQNLVSAPTVYSNNAKGFITPSGTQLNFEELVALPCSDANVTENFVYVVYDEQFCFCLLTHCPII